ncbi:MAG: GNAT family N-acetyltransferase [Desulfovibrio sp.]|jgi:hypothetical protein|nr:GNAT family N-acetyltransferase [Desulfovibrio sp.]
MSDYCMLAYAEVDGVRTFRDTQIWEFHERLLAEGGAHVFRDGSIRDGEAFLRMAKDPSVAFFVAYVQGKVAGVVWLNRRQARWAQCSYFTFREFWGVHATGLGRHCLRELLHLRDGSKKFMLDMLLGLTPVDNRAAVLFALRCGWKRQGVLPCGVFDAATGESQPAVIFTATRGDLQ